VASSQVNEFGIDPEILQDFVSESLDGLSGFEEKLLLLERDPNDRASMDAMFRAIHSIKGNSGFFSLRALKSLAHRVESALDDLRQHKRRLDPALTKLLLSGVDHLRSMVEALRTKAEPQELNPAQQAYLEELEAFLARGTGESARLATAVEALKRARAQFGTSDGLRELEQALALLESEPSAPASAPTQSPAAAAGPSVAPASQARKTMRVEEETIDGFMEFVGILITSSEAFNYLYKRLESEKIDQALAKEFKTAIAAFNALSRNLQKSLMEIRKVPIKVLVGKVPRLVRDLADSLSKQVQVEVEGDDVRIDKSLIEVLDDPLVHMVRNSIDHGVETPETRTKAGKPAIGTLRISARVDRKHFKLTIADDGAGIYPGKIRDAAVRKGILSQQEADALTDEQAIQLIFKPGFSSAENVTDVSGRGVGMDVVLTNIKRANGTVDVRSEPGKGTAVQITLPVTVTVVVMGGLLVRVGDGRYVIPMENVREVVEVDSSELKTVQGSTEMMQIRDRVYPVIRLHKFVLNREPGSVAPRCVVVRIEKDGVGLCLVVDRLLGIQQVVVKDIRDELKRSRLIAGGIILGDGRIGLLLDVKGLIERVTHYNSGAGGVEAFQDPLV